MNIMTKRGSQDNVATYEHLCDTAADLQNIDPRYITLGSIAIILQGTSGGLEIYIADSNKQWNSLTTISGGISGGDFAPDISNPQDGDTLVYDGTAGKWVNGAASGGMVVPVLTTADHGATWTCSHTYAEIAALITAGKCNQIKTVDEGVTVYETLASAESSQIVFCDIYIGEDGALMTDYIVTPDGISVEETKYPDDTSPT